jgi:hypothetical protein
LQLRVGFVVTLFVSLAAAAARPQIALDKLIGPFVAVRSGVDGSGNLWAWNSEEKQVILVSPAGVRRLVDLPGDENAVDADASRGVVALRDYGHGIRVFDWQGKVIGDFGLANPASNVSWLEGDEIAVAPLFTSDLIEVWNVRSRQKVKSWVPVPAVLRPARGAVFARTTLLRYDGKRDELATIDAVTGDVRVVSSSGRVVRTAQLPAATELRGWLEELDKSARAKGEVQTPSMWHYTTMTIADDGSIWVADSYDDKTIRALRVLRGGKVESLTFDSTCPTRRFEAWQGQFIFYQHPKSPRPACVGVRRQ